MKYRTIVADPPWDHSDGTGAKFRIGTSAKTARPLPAKINYTLPYPVLSLTEIKLLPVQDLADPGGCLLYLWVTNRFVRDAWDVAESWGFQPRRLIVWAKEPHGWDPGGKWPSTCEFCLFASTGLLPEVRAPSQWFVWPRKKGPGVGVGQRQTGGHSVKPEAFLDLVEQVSEPPYLELFARRQRLGWDTWGDEALEHVELAV